MTNVQTISKFLNKTLNVRAIPDTSKNGLQVCIPKDVKTIAFAVDASLTTFEKAKKNKADMLIVHHGLIWKKRNDVTGIRKKRINFLKKHKINLYVCHLPLDLNNKYGNNIELAKLLGLQNIKKFGNYHGINIGFMGELKKKTKLSNISKFLDKKLKTKCNVLKFGKQNIKTIGIVSGGGASAFNEANNKNLDCFITGEAGHWIYHEAKDLKQNVILAGHYHTETVGLKALMKLIKEKFDIKTVFIDFPVL